MNSRSHWLSLFSAVIHLIIASPDLFNIGPRSVAASWIIIYSWIPGWEWTWPGLFLFTGIIAMLGGRYSWALRLGFSLTCSLFSIWATVGVYAWYVGKGGTIPGAAANYLIAGFALGLARYVTLGVESDARNVRVERMVEVVQQAENDMRANRSE